jgi:hypothetical protein
VFFRDLSRFHLTKRTQDGAAPIEVPLRVVWAFSRIALKDLKRHADSALRFSARA